MSKKLEEEMESRGLTGYPHKRRGAIGNVGDKEVVKSLMGSNVNSGAPDEGEGEVEPVNVDNDVLISGIRNLPVDLAEFSKLLESLVDLNRTRSLFPYNDIGKHYNTLPTKGRMCLNMCTSIYKIANRILGWGRMGKRPLCEQIKYYIKRLKEYDPDYFTEVSNISLTCRLEDDINALQLIKEKIDTYIKSKFTNPQLNFTPTAGAGAGSKGGYRKRRSTKKVKRSRRRVSRRR